MSELTINRIRDLLETAAELAECDPTPLFATMAEMRRDSALADAMEGEIELRALRNTDGWVDTTFES